MLIVFVLLFSIWLTLTVAIQFDSRFISILSRYDVLGILPRWTFFAPNPGHTDIRVLVRFGSVSGVTPWSELWLSSHIDDRRTAIRGLFNPYRRLDKLLFDFRNAVIGITNPAQIRLSSEYISILAVAESVVPKFGVDTVQFLLAESNYTLGPAFKVILISDMHLIRDQL